MARGRAWRLRSATAYADCVALDLEAADAFPPDRRVLLQPFDDVRRAAAARPAVVASQAWWSGVGARFLSLLTRDGLVTPALARLDLLPYQLEPAIAVARHGAVRVLLADSVGLGKTVQAGIIIAELFARREACRALVLVPAGLRDQWARELRSRFRLEADVVDAAALRAIAVSLPRTVNPWLVPRVAVVSIDFAKRPEVRVGLHEAGWDLVVIDEAHAVGADSERHRAADQLCGRAARVVLITATPHDGLDPAFAALVRLGAAQEGDPIVMFRRSRRDVGLDASRRVKLLRVRLGAAGLDALRTLVAYLRRVWTTQAARPETGARLAAVFLLKRALSSPSALLRSIQRRRALLASEAEPQPRQLVLPLDDDLDAADADACEALGVRGLDDPVEELAWLDRVTAAAAHAALDFRKLRALERLARRCAEPMVVFTEYRDTLSELELRLGRVRRCVTLHGGLGRDAREAVLGAFTDGRADILLATDAAGTGLNLHHRCRLVVNLELPWNPVRLEQRVGRVDRIEQTRPVHAVCLVGRAAPEERILARLAAKAEHARRALADPCEEAWSRLTEFETGEALLGVAPLAALLGGTARPPAAAPAPPAISATPVERPHLAHEARFEADRLGRLRSLRQALGRRAHGEPAGSPATAAAPLVSFVRARPVCEPSSKPGASHAQPRGFAARPRLSRALPGVLAIFEASTVDARGRLLNEMFVPIRLTCGVPRPASRRAARLLAGRLLATLPSMVSPHLAHEVRELVLRTTALVDTAPARAGAPARARSRDGVATRPVQRGLFEHRAERDADAAKRTESGAGFATSEPVRVTAVLPRLRFVLVVTV